MLEIRHPPMPWQKKEIDEHGFDEGRAFFADPGTGKTYTALAEFANLYNAGEVDTLFVLAPNGVHDGWVNEQAPEHLIGDWYGHVWHTKAAGKGFGMHRDSHKKHFNGGTAWHTNSAQKAVRYEGPVIATMTYDAMRTDAGRDFAKKLFKERRCMYILDESHKIKTPGSKITKRTLASAVHCKYRRILTGTAIDESPFDAYSQFRFLDHNVWKRELDIFSSQAFKHYFGIFQEIRPKSGERGFEKLIRYRNMDDLADVMGKIGTVVRKEDVLDDLPPITFQKFYFHMSERQKYIYELMRKDGMAIWKNASCTADRKIVLLLRLQQITSGWVPTDEQMPGDEPQLIDGENSRLKALLEWVSTVGRSQVLVWAYFRRDQQLVLDALRDAGYNTELYDGNLDDVKTRFQQGKFQILVASQARAAEGLNLQNCHLMAYYTNNWKSLQRTQSLARCHRKGQRNPVTVVDFVARGSGDEAMLEALNGKKELAEYVKLKSMAEISGGDTRGRGQNYR